MASERIGRLFEGDEGTSVEFRSSDLLYEGRFREVSGRMGPDGSVQGPMKEDNMKGNLTKSMSGRKGNGNDFGISSDSSGGEPK